MKDNLSNQNIAHIYIYNIAEDSIYLKYMDSEKLDPKISKSVE